MGGHPLINLASHRKDDKYYNKKKRELRKYLPLLREHLSKMDAAGQSKTINYEVLHDFHGQLTDQNRRVPMHILHRGEDLLRREVLQHHEAKESVVEAVWRSQLFRIAVCKKFEDTIELHGNRMNKTPEEMEAYIFTKARTKDEYLEFAARIILYLRQHSTSLIQKELESLKAETVRLPNSGSGGERKAVDASNNTRALNGSSKNPVIDPKVIGNSIPATLQSFKQVS